MSSFLNTTDVKRWLKIGATDAVIENLTITKSLIIPSEVGLTDVLINKQTNIGEVNIVCLDDTEFNLQTATNGNIGDVLKTDGNGNTYWGVAGGIGSGIVYNGTLPIPVGQHTIISVDGLDLTQSAINESATNLDVNGLNITNANDINANQIKNISGNVLYFNTDDNITILNNQALLTTKTIFTEDQELVSKNYVDNNIGSGVVFNGTTPIAEAGHHTTISIDGLELNLSKLIETTNDLNIGFLSIVDATNIECNDIQTFDYFSVNQELQKIDNFGVSTTGLTEIVGVLEVDSVGTNEIYSKDNAANLIQFPNNEDAIKVNTDNFLLNGVQIATIDDIPTADTFQDVYFNSSNPTIVDMVDGKDISFRRLEADILKIGTNFSITTPNIDTQKIEGDFYFPYSSNNLDSWSFATYNFTASASSFVNDDHNPGRAYNKFIENQLFASWICGSGAYDLTTGLPSLGAPTTNVVGLGLVLGEYLTLFTSKSISINGYFLGVIDDVDNPPPLDFQLVGSVDGVSWTLLDTQVGQNIVYPGQSYSFFVGSSPSTKYYRFIVNKIPPNNVAGRCLIGAKTNFTIVSNPNQINLIGDVIEVVSDNFLLNGVQIATIDDVSTSTFQDVYDNSSIPTNINILATKPINFIGPAPSSQIALKILSDTSGFTRIEGNAAAFKFMATDTLSPLFNEQIEILGESAVITDRTIFTEDQEFITKKYVDDKPPGNPFNQNLNTTDNVSFNSVALTAAITTNTQATTKLYVDNKVGTIAITSTDNNLLGVSGVSPTFSLTPKYTYAITFGGNNNGTTSQWLLPGSVRTSTISNTNVATHQALIPINSTLVWASLQRTTTTGSCSLAYSVSNGVAVPITPILTPGQAQNPTPYPLNVNINAGANLAMSVLSSVLSGNTIVSLLLRSN